MLPEPRSAQERDEGRHEEDEALASGEYRHEQDKWEESRIRDALGGGEVVADGWARKEAQELWGPPASSTEPRSKRQREPRSDADNDLFFDSGWDF